MKKIAVVLFNLGGPDKLSSVRGFLFNLFNDPAIISLPNPWRYLLAKLISWRREKIAKEIYKSIGGKSPILEITSSQAEALEKELSFSGNYKVFVSMRYWYPFAKEVVKEIKEYDAQEIILLPLYPQFSTTTTASSFKNFAEEIKKQKVKAKLKYVCCYPTNPGFILAHIHLIKQQIRKAKSLNHQNYRLLFSAHGLPKTIIANGDPYVFQIETSSNLIIAELKKDLKEEIDFQICYQSKVGPMAWTEPSLAFEINRAGLDKKAVIIIPIAFVSDHSETLAELDIEYKHLAQQKNIPLYLRVPALNSDGYFIKSLVDICRKTTESSAVCGVDKICPKSFKKCFKELNY